MGIGDLPGGFAEYTAVYPGMLIPVPSGVDSENAALAEAFAASLHGIECSRAEGGSALVIGGGAIGLALVRLLKLRGFFPICLSEPVESKRRLGLEWGADRAVDPLADHVGAVGFELTGGRMFETVFECSGAEGQVDAAMNLAARGGVVCVVSVMARPVEINPLVLNFKEIWVTGSYSNTHEENREVMDWMAQGRLDGRPLITDRIGLAELPRVYQERIHTGRALKVMVRIGPGF
jgi:(R,R)-butanediol dehydrogenase/meso-butanediol dehydrogenase/diacetyl reductase